MAILSTVIFFRGKYSSGFLGQDQAPRKESVNIELVEDKDFQVTLEWV